MPAGFARVAAMPFPVNAPFRVRADLARLANDGAAPPGLVQSDAAYPAYARIKRAHLGDAVRPLTRVLAGADPERVIGALAAALAAVARSHPEVVGAGEAGGGAAGAGIGPTSGAEFVLRRAALGLVTSPEVRVRALAACAEPLAQRLAGLPPADRALAAFSLALQEDLVLMGWPQWPAGAGDAGLSSPGLVALALSVVFPSGWDPADKLGRALWEIHAPVADGAPLRQASAALSRAMVDKGPFERFVWTLGTDPSLARWPSPPLPPSPPTEPTASQASPSESADLSDMVFRCERQVTLGLPALGASLFLIRVHVAPLLEVCTDPQRRARLVAALRSMSDDVVAYKNLQRLRERVLAAWDR